MYSRRDYPDEETVEELNRQYGDQSLEEDEPLQRRRYFVVRLAAVLVALVFIAFTMGSLLRVVPWPLLGYLSDSRELSEDPFIQDLRAAVVNVRVVPQGSSASLGRMRGGTGFNISPEGLIITNRHVVEDSRMVFVLFPGHGIFQVKERVEHSSADLAALSIAGENLPAVQLSGLPPPGAGEEILVIGNPLGLSRLVAGGRIEGYRYLQPGTAAQAMEISAPIHPGSSGSPVFDARGEVVGVVFATFQVSEGEEDRGLCVPLDVLRGFRRALE